MPPGPPNRNLYLTGFMGAGKTTVGTLLAEELERPFVDTDALIEQRAGMTIAKLFEVEGEAAFRRFEREVVASVAAGQGKVVSLGGGALVDPDSRDRVELSGFVVYLRTRPETILARIKGSDRPLLKGDTKERVAELLASRGALYESAHFKVDTDEKTPEAVAEEVLKGWSSWKK